MFSSNDRLSFTKMRMHWIVAIAIFMVASIWQGYAAHRGESEKGSGLVSAWDPNFYYMWGRSLGVDGDIDFENDIHHLVSQDSLGPVRDKFESYLKLIPKTETGKTLNIYSMGLGVISLPAIGVVRVIHTLSNTSSPFAIDYFIAFICSSIFIACLGLAFALRELITRYTVSIAYLSGLCCVAGLSLGYYILFEPGMTHAASFGVNTLFILTSLHWVAYFKQTVISSNSRGLFSISAVMGFLLGVACLIRFNNLIYATIPVTLAILAWKQHNQRCPVTNDTPTQKTSIWLKVCLRCACIASICSLIGFSPQLFAWSSLFGSPLVNTYDLPIIKEFANTSLTLFPSSAPSVLFGSHNGLFLWTPLAALSVIGLVFGAKRKDHLSIAGIIALITTTWLYGSWSIPSLGHAFGMRGFVDISFIFMIGFAEFCLGIPQRLKQAVIVFISLLICWNLYFMICYRASIQPHGEGFAGIELFQHSDRWLDQLATDTGIKRLLHLLSN